MKHLRINISFTDKGNPPHESIIRLGTNFVLSNYDITISHKISFPHFWVASTCIISHAWEKTKQWFTYLRAVHCSRAFVPCAYIFRKA